MGAEKAEQSESAPDFFDYMILDIKSLTTINTTLGLFSKNPCISVIQHIMTATIAPHNKIELRHENTP